MAFGLFSTISGACSIWWQCLGDWFLKWKENGNTTIRNWKIATYRSLNKLEVDKSHQVSSLTSSHESLRQILPQTLEHCEIDSPESGPNDCTLVRLHPELTYQQTWAQEGSDIGYLGTYSIHAKINLQIDSHYKHLFNSTHLYSFTHIINKNHSKCPKIRLESWEKSNPYKECIIDWCNPFIVIRLICLIQNVD